MAGHASNWIKVGNVAGASSKGRVYISPIVLKRAQAKAKEEVAILKSIAKGKADRRWVDESLRAKGCTF